MYSYSANMVCSMTVCLHGLVEGWDAGKQPSLAGVDGFAGGLGIC